MPQNSVIQRAKTAIKRYQLSKPMRLVFENELIHEGESVFDYGCGHGDDIRFLNSNGISARGWDPFHQPKAELIESDVVNLGFVLNVIEEPQERIETLLNAWSLTKSRLIVSARMTFDRTEFTSSDPLADGCVTSKGTFQKFYGQQELRDFVAEVLQLRTVSIAPGVIAAFRDESERQTFLAKRYRRGPAIFRPRLSDILFEEHRDLLQQLSDFAIERGRLPKKAEQSWCHALEEHMGSIVRAARVIKTVMGTESWDAAKADARESLLIHFALEKFGGRPRFSELPLTLQYDVRDLFGNYKTCCLEADHLLYQAGDPEAISNAIDESDIGKKTGNALYIHLSAVGSLSPLLKIYEGCAQAYYGVDEDATLLKLHRFKPKVSYLEYPTFDREGHPPLRGSYVISMGAFKVRYYDYSNSKNPSILHRKELLVDENYSLRGRFERLTRQEERSGLLDSDESIGRAQEWGELLEAKGLEVRGHRLYRLKKTPDSPS